MKKAFTLIELIVMMAIVAIFTTIIFVDYGKNNKLFALERSARKMSQDVRKVQEMAMSGFVGGVGTNGYGIYFNTTSNTSYRVYANMDSDMSYSQGTDTDKENISMESGVKICNLLVDSSSVNPVSVSFAPPDPINYINNVDSGHEASIVLCIVGDESQTRTVKVNNVGRIELTNP
ncbi:MAG: type II secretion system protein [Candidatus Pacebacteria bacterium]|nr:type II secretion system protein [Candidatus Paceibacterota bacterium]